MSITCRWVHFSFTVSRETINRAEKLCLPQVIGNLNHFFWRLQWFAKSRYKCFGWLLLEIKIIFMFLVYDKSLTYYKNIPTTIALHTMTVKPHFSTFLKKEKRTTWIAMIKMQDTCQLDHYLYYLSDILIAITHMHA